MTSLSFLMREVVTTSNMCRRSMTNSLGLWKFMRLMLDKKGLPFQGSLFSNIFGLVFMSTTDLLTGKLLLSLVHFYLQLLTILLVTDYSVLVAGWDRTPGLILPCRHLAVFNKGREPCSPLISPTSSQQNH